MYGLSLVVQFVTHSFFICFCKSQARQTEKRFIKWNSRNFSYAIINIDGTSNAAPTRIGFSGTFHASLGNANAVPL